MAEEFPFRAGALLKWLDGNSLNTVYGRVILLIEAGDDDTALLMRDQLSTDPKFIKELLTTLEPWPDDYIKVNTKEMNKHSTIKSILYRDPEKEKEI